MCRYYSRRFHNEHTIIIQKKTALICDYIDALIKDVEDDEKDKVIFITNVEGTTPDATCYYPENQGNLDIFYGLKIIDLKELLQHNLGRKYVKMFAKTHEHFELAGTWGIKLSDSDVGDMLKHTCNYFIEIENGETLTIERFRKELLDTFPMLRYEYEHDIDYQEQIDYINEENEMLEKHFGKLLT